MINTCMKINDITDLDKLWASIDGRLNPEALENRKEYKSHYESGTQVEVKPEPVNANDRYTTKPPPKTNQSSGFRGRESVKRASDQSYHPYQRRNDDRALPRDHQQD